MFDKKRQILQAKTPVTCIKGYIVFPLIQSPEHLFYKLQNALKCIDSIVESEYLLCNAESYKKKKRKVLTRLEKKVMETLAASLLPKKKKKVKFILCFEAVF